MIKNLLQSICLAALCCVIIAYGEIQAQHPVKSAETQQSEKENNEFAECVSEDIPEAPCPNYSYVEDAVEEQATSSDTESESISSVEHSSETNESSIEEHVHSFGEWTITQNATCEVNGIQVRQCSLCGEYEEEALQALGHTEQQLPERAPSCTEPGLGLGVKCSTCEQILCEQTEIAPLGHTYTEKENIASTCTQKGYIIYECACGDSYKESHKDLAKHVYKTKIVAPTCSSKGYTLHKCDTCGDTYKDNYTEQDHEYETTTVAPTCKSQGYTLQQCKLCKASNKTNITAKVPHQYVQEVVLPTLSTSGYTTHTCKSCNDTYTDNKTTYDSICKNGYANNKKVLATGIDVSKWNHKKDASGNYLPLDWAAIKNTGVDFVILKAGSTKGPDPVFEMNYKAARAVGLEVGAYYYVYAMDAEGARKDALDFVSLIKGKKFEYPLYMDFEDASQRDIPAQTKTEMIKVFATTLQEAGYYAGLYTGYYWMNPRFDILETETVVDMLDIWFAHIDSATSVSINTKYTWTASNNLGHSEFGMWQYAHKGVFDFIKNEHFDFNYAYKDYPSIIKKLGLNGYEGYVYEPEYVWVKVRNLNVRSYWDTSVSSNILGIIHKGDKYEILEKTSEYIKIRYQGDIAFISADPDHVSFTAVST